MITKNLGVQVVSAIENAHLQALFDGHILAVHVPGYFSKTLASKAHHWLIKHTLPRRWMLGKNADTPTDMGYMLGLPRQLAYQSPEAMSEYRDSVEKFLPRLREAFGTSTPLEQFLSELNSILPEGLKTEEFEGGNGQLGIVRCMTPEFSLDHEGICHIDSLSTKKQLSVNMYVAMPPTGGELKIWNLPIEERHPDRNLYRLIAHHAFEDTYRDKIQGLLPHPIVIAPQAGDLVIFDTSQPHAVRGFSDGHRITLQTFLMRKNDRTVLFS